METFAERALVVNNGSEIVTSLLFHARRMPPRVPVAGR
jgi:hypothetical protein